MLKIRKTTAALALTLSAALALPALAGDRNELGYATGSALVTGLSGNSGEDAQGSYSRAAYSSAAAGQAGESGIADSQVLSAWQDIVNANKRGEVPLVVAQADARPAAAVSGYSLADALAEAKWRKRAMNSLRSLD